MECLLHILALDPDANITEAVPLESTIHFGQLCMRVVRPVQALSKLPQQPEHVLPCAFQEGFCCGTIVINVVRVVRTNLIGHLSQKSTTALTRREIARLIIVARHFDLLPQFRGEETLAIVELNQVSLFIWPIALDIIFSSTPTRIASSKTLEINVCCKRLVVEDVMCN